MGGEKSQSTVLADDKNSAGNDNEQGDIPDLSESSEALGTANKEELSKKEVNQRVLSIALPALVELMLVQLCSMVDTMMVGKLGPWAISAVGYCTQPRFLLLAVFIALNTGSTALISRAKGEGDRELANRVLKQTIMISTLLSIVISMIGFFASRPMVVFMGANEDIIIEASTQYMQIQMLGFTFNAITLSVTACLRGIGKTKVSMYYNMISNIVNVILNYLLINGNFGFPRMEVAGASLATIIGQGVALVVAAVVILKMDDYLRLDLRQFFKVDKSIVKRIVRVGLPAMSEQLIMRLGMVIYTITITSLGSVAFATHQIANSILAMTFMTGQAFGISATTLMGQSLGRRDKEAAKIYTLTCRRYGMMCSIVLAASFILFGRYMVMLYTDDASIIDEAARILLIVAVMQPLQTSQLIINGALRGAGDTMVVAVITFVGILIVRPLLSMVAINVFHIGLIGAWIAMSTDQVMRSLVSYVRFNTGKWADIRV